MTGGTVEKWISETEGLGGLRQESRACPLEQGQR